MISSWEEFLPCLTLPCKRSHIRAHTYLRVPLAAGSIWSQQWHRWRSVTPATWRSLSILLWMKWLASCLCVCSWALVLWRLFIKTPVGVLHLSGTADQSCKWTKLQFDPSGRRGTRRSVTKCTIDDYSPRTASTVAQYHSSSSFSGHMPQRCCGSMSGTVVPPGHPGVLLLAGINGLLFGEPNGPDGAQSCEATGLPDHERCGPNPGSCSWQQKYSLIKVKKYPLGWKNG